MAWDAAATFYTGEGVVPDETVHTGGALDRRRHRLRGCCSRLLRRGRSRCSGCVGGVAPACPSSSAGGSGVDRSLSVGGTFAFLPVCAWRSQSAPVGVTASFPRGTPFFPRSSVQTIAAAAPPRGATSRWPHTTSGMATPTGWLFRGAVVFCDDRRRIAPAEAVYDREKAPPAGPSVGAP